MEIKEDLKRVTIRIPDELHAWLSSCAKKEATSINSLVIRKLRENMENPNEDDPISENDFLPAVLEIEKQLKKMKAVCEQRIDEPLATEDISNADLNLLKLIKSLPQKQQATITKSIKSIISDFC